MHPSGTIKHWRIHDDPSYRSLLASKHYGIIFGTFKANTNVGVILADCCLKKVDLKTAVELSISMLTWCIILLV